LSSQKDQKSQNNKTEGINMVNGCKTNDEKFVLKEIVFKLFDINTDMKIAKSMNGFKRFDNMTEEEKKEWKQYQNVKKNLMEPIIDTIDNIPSCPEK
jgi:hypothetical protein